MSMPRTQQDFNDYIAGEMREADKSMDKLVEDMRPAASTLTIPSLG